MARCLMCASLIGDPNMRYHLSNMDPELTTAIESQIGHDPEDGELCEECFNHTLTSVVTNSRERSLSQDSHVCIWCRSSLFRRRSHAIPESLERIVISEQISPRMISEGALVCYPCWVRASRIASSQNLEFVVAAPISNANICTICETSLSTRRSHGIPIGPERNYIATAIHPREITPNGRVCWTCWRRAQRNSQDISNQQQYECASCRISLIRRPYRLLGNGPEHVELSARVFPRQIPDMAHVCHDCWRNLQSIPEPQNVEEEIPAMPPIPTMELNNFKRTANSGRHCFVPECHNIERNIVPQYLRYNIFKSKRIFVARNCRVCNEHLHVYDWDILDQFDFSNHFNQNEIEDMLEMNVTNEEKIPISFENINDYADNIVKYWTGVSKIQFNDILRETPGLSVSCKHPKTALGVFLIKCRTGDSHDRIASLFQISKSKLVKMLKQTRECLKTEFMPRYIGLNHIGREELIGRNLIIPEGLFGDQNNRKPIVICDGSYIYVQKSSNYLFQKKTYSLHKHDNLVKPFLIVACDGHIVDVQGPYAAIDSDADIMKALFQDENSEYRNYFEENDIFILDRGFRDALPLLESLGYNINKPESVERGETQLSTIKANKSRYVTLCRWVVEIVNGRFKRDFKLFRQDYFNLAAGHLFDDFKICAAILNAFHPVIEDRPDAQLLLNRAQARLNMPNNLAEYILVNNVNQQRAQFVNINEFNPALDIFPQMTISNLIMFSLGSYQIKQAKSYYGEHIRRNGSFEVEISNELHQVNMPGLESSHETLLLRGKIKSRHQGSKVYNTYIILSPGGNDWDDRIKAYYCSCICGKRTVGCCSHVMTIVWYLGWARHQANIEPPACPSSCNPQQKNLNEIEF